MRVEPVYRTNAGVQGDLEPKAAPPPDSGTPTDSFSIQPHLEYLKRLYCPLLVHSGYLPRFDWRQFTA